MTIAITPEAVEHLSHHNDIGGDVLLFAPTIRALSAALTASQAETAAAYELVAAKLSANIPPSLAAYVHQSILALTPADSKAALDRLIAEDRADALSGPWDDKPDALTDTVEAAHPHHTKDFATYVEALELVSNRHSKGALVGLVNYLLAKNKAITKGKDHE